jgi:outer membrane protein TolC
MQTFLVRADQLRPTDGRLAGAAFRTAAIVALALVATPGLAWAQAQPQPPAPSMPPPAAGPAAPQGPALELTMARAVELALQSNLGLEADRMIVEDASLAIASARASFLPQVGTTVSRSSQRSVPNDFTQGSADITSQGVNVSSSLNHALPFLGTTYALQWNSSRNTQEGGFPLFNPSLGSNFSFSLSQPLWRGFMIDPDRADYTISQRQRVNADVQLQQEMTVLEANVKNAYLTLISAIQGLRVAEQNLEIVQTSFANARARVEVGAAAPIELISAEAEVAVNQERVILARAQIETFEDALRTLILDPERPDYWQVRLVPTDTIQAEAPTIDLDAIVTKALSERLDLAVMRRNLEIEDLQLRVARDATRPGVNLNLNYASRGSGGTRFTYGEGFPPEVESRTVRSFGSVLGDAFGAAYPAWTVGLNVTYPVGRSVQDANYARAEVARRQSALALRELEIGIVQQVRDAVRQVENSYQRVLVTRAALRASEQQLDAEQRRFSAGLATTLELQIRQQQLADARVSELNAAIAYNRALIQLERVQKTQ